MDSSDLHMCLCAHTYNTNKIKKINNSAGHGGVLVIPGLKGEDRHIPGALWLSAYLVNFKPVRDPNLKTR